jgi:hypothetical protein
MWVSARISREIRDAAEENLPGILHSAPEA